MENTKDLKMALEKIESILGKWEEDDLLETAYYSSVKIILREIKKNNLIPIHISDKVTNLHWNFDSMIGIDNGNGYTFKDHKNWAYGDLGIICRESV